MSLNPSDIDLDGALPSSSSAADVPGAYPGDPASQSISDGHGAKETLHHSAEAYIAPERLDQVEHLVEGVGSRAAHYVPVGVASAVSNYWCEWKLLLRARFLAAPARRSRPSSTPISGRKCRSIGPLWTGIGWFILGLVWLFWGGETPFFFIIRLAIF